MKWVFSHQSPDNYKWLLQDAQEPAQFTYNLLQRSIRIKAKSSRLFFLEITGFFQKKVRLLSEYGVVLGETAITAFSKKGMFTINEQKYFFQWENNRLCLLDKSKSVLSNVVIEGVNEMKQLDLFALLFSHAWIIFSDTNPGNESLLVA